MPKTTQYCTDLLKLIFTAVTYTNVATSTGFANMTAALHTASPGLAGLQTTSEMPTTAYVQYARVNVARTAGGWTVGTNAVTPVAAITFPAGTSGSGTTTATDFSLGTGTSSVCLYYGTITPQIVCGNGVTPSLSTATSVTET